MARFTDRNGDAWVIDINVTSLKRLKKNGFDIGNMLDDGSVITRMMNDPIFLVDMIYVLCEKQADMRNVSDEDFGELVGNGEVIDSAIEAFIEELTLFYRSKGRVIRKAMERYESLQKKMVEKALEKIDTMDEGKVMENFGKQLTMSLGSLDSTQGPSPSES